jgi:hypothetical protein
MIVIFCDGASYETSQQVTVGLVGFLANEEGVIQKHLFSIQSEFSGKYAIHEVHEDFAVIKALAQAKNYPDEKIVICNDHLAAIRKIIMGQLDRVRSSVRYYIWTKINLDILKHQDISLVELNRDTFGMNLADMVSKKYLDNKVIESKKFKNFISLMQGKNYWQPSTKEEKIKLGNYRGNVKAHCKISQKQKYITPQYWPLTPYEQNRQQRTMCWL